MEPVIEGRVQHDDGRRARKQGPAVDPHAREISVLKRSIDAHIEQLSEQLMKLMMRTGAAGSAEVTERQRQLELLGQIAAGLGVVAADALPATGAGFGSVVAVHDLDTGERREYTLMLGALVDIDAGQVSLASPVGQALIGKAPGSVVAVALPHRLLRLRITGLTTLRDRTAEPPLTA